MRGKIGQIALIVVVGVILGVAIAGVPKRGSDAGSRVALIETTTTVAPTPSSTTPPTTAAPPPAPAPRSPGAVTVVVANASSVVGSAKRISVKLTGLKYHVLDPDPNQPNQSGATIYFRDGSAAEAAALADALGVGRDQVRPMPTPPQSARAATADVFVVVGQDLASRR